MGDETYVMYLRQIAADHRASGFHFTAHDYETAAARIERLEATIRLLLPEAGRPSDWSHENVCIGARNTLRDQEIPS